MRYLFVLVLVFSHLWAVGLAQAQSVVYSTFGGSYVIQDADLAAKINARNAVDRILAQVPSGDVSLSEKIKPTIGSVQAEMTAKRTIPWAGVAGVAAKAAGWAGVAVTAYQLWDSVRAKPVGGGIAYDEGVPQETVPGYTCGPASEPQYQRTGPSPGTACNSYAVDYFARTNVSDSTWTRSTSIDSVTCGSGTCSIQGTLTATRFPDGFVSTLPQGITVPFVASTTQQCPASIDALNPANSIPAGLPPQGDGKCKTGRYNSTLSQIELASKISEYGDKSKADEVIAEGAANNDVNPHAWGPTSLSGPSSVQQPPIVTTTTTPSGTSTQTVTVTNNITYQGNTYNYSTETTTVAGDTTTTTNAPPAAELETCGLPGKPPCKIDEAGTPTYQENAQARASVEALPGLEQQRMSGQSAAVDGAAPSFGFFGAPPLAECTPFEFNGKGQLDPCPVVTTAREVMAYLWALVAGWLCFGWIRQTINGGS